MINTYSSLYITDGASQTLQADRINMFIPFSAISEDGSISSYTAGNDVAQELGLTFIVDHWVPEQFDRLKVDTSTFPPSLIEKEGQEITCPLTDQEKRIKQLEQEILNLKSQ